MNPAQFGDMFQQRFDTAALAAAARAQSAIPLRRPGVLTELVIVGVAACLAGEPVDLPKPRTLVILGSRVGARAVCSQVIREIVIARDAPFPYDFLATQPILAAVPLQQTFPCITNVLYQPWGDDVELHWQRLRTLARAWLQAGRCERAICGQVESVGKSEQSEQSEQSEHYGQWQVAVISDT